MTFSPSFSSIIRVKVQDRPGAFADLARAIGDAGGNLDVIDIVRVESGYKVRDVTVQAVDGEHVERIVAAVRAVRGVEVEAVSDRTFLLHLGGKIQVAPKQPLKTRDDLSMAYTPGVARVCRAIADDPDAVWNLTVKRNTVAVVTDGTAVLGLGDIGPAASLPVMEGKAMLFREFGGIDAWPIALDTTDTDEIVRTVTALAPGFGGINLEDISAPRCFEIERRLDEALDIPVFHDDQHGTAVVVFAGLLNALRIVGKDLEDVKIVLTGAGAAGVAVARMLVGDGARHVVVCDRLGVVHARRPGLGESKQALAELTSPQDTGSANDALRGADVFIGLSSPGAVSVDAVRSMADGAVVFALANPIPEIAPEELSDRVAVVATGRSDHPNQINNALVFPGIFRGALDVRARTITPRMRSAAAHALARIITDDELSPDYIIPSIFDRRVAPTIAATVSAAAEQDGVARRAAPELARA